MSLSNNILCIVCLGAMCASYIETVSAEESAAEESFMDSAKILGKLVDDVSEMKQGIRLLEKAILGKGYIKGEGDTLDETNDHDKSSKVRIIVSFPTDDIIECRVEHEWKQVSEVIWAIKGMMVFDSQYKQVKGEDFFAITVPTVALSDLNRNGQPDEFYIAATVSNVMYGIAIVIPPFNESSTTTRSPNMQRQSLIKEIVFNPLTVISGTKNIAYTPGEYIDIKLHSHLNRRVDGTLYSLKEEQTGTGAVLHIDHRFDGVLNITQGQPSDTWTHEISINTESLLNGGILSIVEYSELNNTLPFEQLIINMIQPFYMYLASSDSPIPSERVAISKQNFQQNQTLSLFAPESPVSCFAVGNPTPEIEFRHEGHPMQLEQMGSIHPYMVASYILVPRNVDYRQITCHAKSGKGEDDMTINFSYEIIIDEEKSGFRRLSDKLIEVTCTAIGKEAPNIYFVVNYGEKLSVDDEHVETIVSASTQNTTRSQLVYDTSDLDNLWDVECIGELGGQEQRKYFPVLN